MLLREIVRGIGYDHADGITSDPTIAGSLSWTGMNNGDARTNHAFMTEVHLTTDDNLAAGHTWIRN